MTHNRNRALCCQTGNLRTVSDNFSRFDENRTRDDNEHPDGWRMTMTLKCSLCKGATQHAILRDNCPTNFRDVAETRQHLQPGTGLSSWPAR